MRQVARELGINHETLRNWVRTAENAQTVRQPGSVSADEHQEVQVLRKRVAELELEKEILRKAAAYSPRRWVVDLQLPVHLRRPRRLRRRPAVQNPRVRRPGFSEWLAAAPVGAERAESDERLAAEITEVRTRAPTAVRGLWPSWAGAA
ncbi:transposase [Amycolatopsis sp. NPDC023774]|uniref:transposase n=1 Tax=Amycolatopsis sp. NPDC023774 TaxID=3155015 RepID=UPI0034059F3D